MVDVYMFGVSFGELLTNMSFSSTHGWLYVFHFNFSRFQGPTYAFWRVVDATWVFFYEWMNDTKQNMMQREESRKTQRVIILLHTFSRATFSLSCNPSMQNFTIKHSIVHTYNQEHLLQPARSKTPLNT